MMWANAARFNTPSLRERPTITVRKMEVVEGRMFRVHASPAALWCAPNDVSGRLEVYFLFILEATDQHVTNIEMVNRRVPVLGMVPASQSNDLVMCRRVEAHLSP